MRREMELTIEEVVKFLESDSIDVYLFKPEKQVNAGK